MEDPQDQPLDPVVEQKAKNMLALAQSYLESLLTNPRKYHNQIASVFEYQSNKELLRKAEASFQLLSENGKEERPRDSTDVHRWLRNIRKNGNKWPKE